MLQRNEFCFSKSLEHQYPLADSTPKGTAGWVRALSLRFRCGSVRFIAPMGGFYSNSLCSSIDLHHSNISMSHATHHAACRCVFPRSSALLSTGGDPHETGAGQGVTQQPTRGARLASQPRTSRAAPRARSPPRNRSERAFLFPSVTVCLTSHQC